MVFFKLWYEHGINFCRECVGGGGEENGIANVICKLPFPSWRQCVTAYDTLTIDFPAFWPTLRVGAWTPNVTTHKWSTKWLCSHGIFSPWWLNSRSPFPVPAVLHLSCENHIWHCSSVGIWGLLINLVTPGYLQTPSWYRAPASTYQRGRQCKIIWIVFINRDSKVIIFLCLFVRVCVCMCLLVCRDICLDQSRDWCHINYILHVYKWDVHQHDYHRREMAVASTTIDEISISRASRLVKRVQIIDGTLTVTIWPDFRVIFKISHWPCWG